MGSRQPFCMSVRDSVTFIEMKRIFRWKVGRGGGRWCLLLSLLRWGRRLSDRRRILIWLVGRGLRRKVSAARIGGRADLDKKYTVEVYARLVKLVGALKVKGFSGK